MKWVKLGCSFLTTLLSSQEGLRYLQTEDPFLPQIVKSFAQLDPFNAGPTDSDPIFSKKKIAETLSYGYLEMLGTLSQQKEGIELMEKFKIFTAFYRLSDLGSTADLIKGIIENLDYSIDGHPRIVLSKALTLRYKDIRHYATCHLGNLIRSSPSANPWMLRLLLTQLYDPAPEVCEVAVQLLETACESQEVLQLVVEMQPTMEHLGELGHPLLMKFMSTLMGFRYLYHAGYVDREMDMWFHERNIWYAVQVEIFLSTAFAHKSERDDLLSFEGTVPPHFYGQMAKTDLGCQILAEKGHFTEFVHFIRTHGQESDDSVMIMKLKSILWAVGNIGATEGGLPFLEENEIVPTILEIAETSAVPSVRGTCFFVLGLISTTSLGAEILDDYHWEATLSPLSLPTGLCLPVDLHGFVAIPHWSPPVSTAEEDNSLALPTEQAEIEVMTAIQNLSNTVIANAASRSLAKMRSRSEYKHIFTSPIMFFRALHTISTQRYRLPVRRYVLDLFNVELDVGTVKVMDAASKSLRIKKPGPSSETSNKDKNVHPTVNTNIVHIIPRVESDEEDEEDEFGDSIRGDRAKRKSNVVVEKLRPVSRIIGFAA
jgi:rapamycin-insensitive companion of mTOR